MEESKPCQQWKNVLLRKLAFKNAAKLIGRIISQGGICLSVKWATRASCLVQRLNQSKSPYRPTLGVNRSLSLRTRSDFLRSNLTSTETARFCSRGAAAPFVWVNNSVIHQQLSTDVKGFCESKHMTILYRSGHDNYCTIAISALTE